MLEKNKLNFSFDEIKFFILKMSSNAKLFLFIFKFEISPYIGKISDGNYKNDVILNFELKVINYDL